MKTQRFIAASLAVLALCAVGGSVWADDDDDKDAARAAELESLRKRVELLEKQDEEAQEAAAPAAKWYDKVNFGGALRVFFRTVEDASSDGRTPSKDFTLETARIYSGAKINDLVSATVNLESDIGVFAESADSSGDTLVQHVHPLDVFADLTFVDEFKVRVGRHIPPSDRENYNGPYYQSTWDYPVVVSGGAPGGYYARFSGRDDGVTLWGEIDAGEENEKAIRYQIGAFQGLTPAVPGADHLMYSGRLTVNLLEAESGFYNAGTYYGGKEVVTIGVAGQWQADAVGIVGDKKNWVTYNVDLMIEKKLDFLKEFLADTPLETFADGAVTLTGAYYEYGRGGYAGEGNGAMFVGAYTYPEVIGWGLIQPNVRLQFFGGDKDMTRNPSTVDIHRWDVGVNYVISGHNARISIVYTSTQTEDVKVSGPEDRTIMHMFTVGTQIQF